MWGRYLTRQEWAGTGVHIALLVIAVVSAVMFRRLAGETLEGKQRERFEWSKAFTGNKTRLAASLVVVIGGLFSMFSYGVFHGLKEDTWVRWARAGVGFNPFADLQREELESFSFRKAVLKNANFDRANLTDADLSGAHLQHATLESADLQGAVLQDTDLRWAEMGEADLQDAILWGAKLQAANLYRANLRDADLSGAHLQHATLELADLQGAYLQDTDLRWAEMGGADLQDAILWEAKLQFANLVATKFTGAELDGAELECADLRQTVGLTASQIQDAADWEKAFYDEERLKELGLGDDHNEKQEKECEDRDEEDLTSHEAKSSAAGINEKAQRSR